MLKGKISILIPYSLSIAFIAKELRDELLSLAEDDGRVVVYKTNSPRPISVKHIQGLLTRKLAFEFVTEYKAIKDWHIDEDYAITAFHKLNGKFLYKLKLISKAVYNNY